MPTRRIFFSRLAIDSHIGILDHERGATQPLHVDAEFEVLDPAPPSRDDIREVLDYRRLRETIIDECSRTHVDLLETLCERLAKRLLGDYPDVRSLRLRIGKPMAFADCAAVGIELSVSRDTA